MEILLWLALASLPLGFLIAISGAVVAVALRRSASIVALAVLVAVLLAVWVTITYQDGVRADETGTSGNVFSSVGWLIVAAVVGAGAALLALRRRPEPRIRGVAGSR